MEDVPEITTEGTPAIGRLSSSDSEPLCETVIVGDLNGDCNVDFADLEIIALHWLEGRP
jgi:hypothetical protein